MLHLYLPTGFAPNASPIGGISCLSGPQDAANAALSGQAVLFGSHGKQGFYGVITKVSGVHVTLNKPQPIARSEASSLIIKWQFGRGGRSFPWGGEMKLALLPCHLVAGPPALMRQRIAKCATSVAPALFEADLSLLETAVNILCGEEALGASGRGAFRDLISCNHGMEIRLREAVDAEIARFEAQDRTRKEENAAAQDLFSSLPDGTPLVIRGPSGRTWQLGLKKGRVPLGMARNAIIAPAEILRGDNLREAGLSNHDILPLMIAADQARSAFPKASRFQTCQPELRSDYTLHAGAPFHQSFQMERRGKQAPEAWMQTGWPKSNGAIFSIDGAEPRWRAGRFGPTVQMPPRSTSPQTSVRISQKLSSWGPNGDITIPRFAHLAHLWCIEREVVETMKTFDLGSIGFAPVEILKLDGTPYPGERFYLTADRTVQAVATQRCDPDILRISGGRTVQPFEIHVDREKARGLDMWLDDSIRNGTLFFSDRLVKALKHMKAMPQLAAKPCAAA